MSILLPAVFLALLTYWLHRRLVRAPRLPRPAALAADAVLIAGAALALIGASSGKGFDPSWARGPAFTGWTWLAVVFYLVLGISLIGIASLVARAIHRIRRPGDPEARTDSDAAFARRRLTAIRASSAFLVVGAVATVAYGLTEAATPEVTTTAIEFDSLPAEFDGLRVAVVSDLHVGPARGADLTEKVVELVAAQNPDLVILAGDLSDGTVDLVGDTLTPLDALSAPLGVFGISGNHEFYSDDGGAWLDEWERHGVTTLRNERVELTRGGASIQLAGIHDATAPAPYEPDLAAALAGRDESGFVLLAAHEPRQAFEASDLGVDLQVSGHTHGGQLWPFGYLVGLQQPTVQGLDHVGDTTIYTTRGAGAWGPPVRVGAPPEVTVLELHRR